MRVPKDLRALLLLLALDFLLQAFGLWRSIDVNPALESPTGDAEEYWEWSERIADGEWVGDTPYLSAPLYPYFVGLVRALGGGMITLFALQLLLRTLTAWMLARLASRLFGHPGYALATAFLFLWLEEPAYYAVRILNSSLQLFTLAWLLTCIQQRQATAAEELRPRTSWKLGVALGIAILANPSLMVVIPFFLWWSGVRPPQLRHTAFLLAGTILCLIPTTWHNALATSKGPAGAEFIPLSAQAGLTLAHGNSPLADGTYQPVDGVSASRSKQNVDAYAQAKEATGKEGWKHTSNYFRDQALDYLLSNPGEAFLLELRKLRWFFCGRNYGDVYVIPLENEDEAWPRPVPLPGGLLQLGWILPAAFVGLFFLIRQRGREAIPYAALLLSVLFVVMVFWYSPRYRLPAAPLAALLAPFGILALAQALGRRSSKPLLAALALGPGLLLEGWSLTSGFDTSDGSRALFEQGVGLNYLKLGKPELAIQRLERSKELGLTNAWILHGIAECKVSFAAAHDRAGRPDLANPLYDQALNDYADALEINPTRLDTWFSYASVLEYVGRKAEAMAAVEQALVHARSQENPSVTARLEQLRARLRGGR